MSKPSYAARKKAVEDSIELMKSMQLPLTPTVGAALFGVSKAPIDRFEVVELARFLLGIDEEKTS